MLYTVFFRERKTVVPADRFIDQQPEAHRHLLQTIADTLAQAGQIVHPQVTKNAKGDWSV